MKTEKEIISVDDKRERVCEDERQKEEEKNRKRENVRED